MPTVLEQRSVTPVTERRAWNSSSLQKRSQLRLIPELESQAEPNLAHDSSTNALVQRFRKYKEIL